MKQFFDADWWKQNSYALDSDAPQTPKNNLNGKEVNKQNSNEKN
jgi:hypothetical protein